MTKQVGQTYVTSRFRATRPRTRVFAKGGRFDIAKASRWIEAQNYYVAGKGYANGGNVTIAGPYLIGERGPEYVNLPPGTTVSWTHP